MTKKTLLIIILVVSGMALAQDGDIPSEVEELAWQGVESNADWTPYSQEINGVEMVLVPAGCFMMGSSDEQIEIANQFCEASAANGANPRCDLRGFELEAPQHAQCFDAPFWIDKTEVTQAMYASCVAEGVCEEAYPGSNGDNLPISRITWFQAQDYCEWRDARLPTEREWEYAARGLDNLIFPWGNEFDNNLANMCDAVCPFTPSNGGYADGFPVFAPAGIFAEGASWVGALDMSGNVWEWTGSIFQSYPYDENDGRENSDDSESPRVVRGGSWISADTARLRTTYRFSPFEESDDYTGFRCARSYSD